MKGFKNRLILTSLIVLILGVLSACGNSASNAGSAQKTGDNKGAASDQDSGNKQPASSQANKKKVVVYTNAGGEGRADWVQQEAAKKGFDVQFVQAGGGDLANRLIAEKK